MVEDSSLICQISSFHREMVFDAVKFGIIRFWCHILRVKFQNSYYQHEDEIVTKYDRSVKENVK